MALISILAARRILRSRWSFYSPINYSSAHRNYRPSRSSIQRSSFSYAIACIHSLSSPDYVWHPAEQSSNSQQDSSKGPIVAAVLVGWVGAEQRHLRKYAEWYASRGIHAITVSVPMRDLLSYYLGTRAQFKTKLLVLALDEWLNEDQGTPGDRSVFFHTFCGGWLIYSFILETMLSRHRQLAGRIKGCIIDSSPPYKPDPEIWARGFSIAILKKRSSYVATSDQSAQTKCRAIESIIVAILNIFFSVFLNLPRTRRRFNNSVELLSKKQPPYPQLYLYSSGDRVLPGELVKEFMIQQRRDGRRVSSYDFKRSGHVSHMRDEPHLYSTQLTAFIHNCLSSSSQI